MDHSKGYFPNKYKDQNEIEGNSTFSMLCEYVAPFEMAGHTSNDQYEHFDCISVDASETNQPLNSTRNSETFELIDSHVKIDVKDETEEPFENIEENNEANSEEHEYMLTENFENIETDHASILQSQETEKFENITFHGIDHKNVEETFENIEKHVIGSPQENVKETFENIEKHGIETLQEKAEETFENIEHGPQTMSESFDDLRAHVGESKKQIISDSQKQNISVSEKQNTSDSICHIEANCADVSANSGELYEHIEVYETMADKLCKHDRKYRKLIDKWTKEQIRLSQSRDQRMIIPKDIYTNLKFIAGVDISFPKDENDLIHACACLVVLTYPDLDIVYKNCKIVHLTSVYIPQYLAFREVDPYLELLEQLKEELPEVYPQIILVDGNGLLHPRKFGIASHLGTLLNVTTIGVAKKLFHVDGLVKDEKFKENISKLKTRGSTMNLLGKNNFLYGRALKSTEKSSNPIFVSIGYDIDLESATQIILGCCKMRVPEPIRWADISSREYIREHYDDHAKGCFEYHDLNNEFLELTKL